MPAMLALSHIVGASLCILVQSHHRTPGSMVFALNTPTATVAVSLGMGMALPARPTYARPGGTIY